MAQAIAALQKLQIGKEIVRGTTVAATRRLIGDARASWETPIEDFAKNDYGVTARTAKAPLITRHGFGLEIKQQLNYEQIVGYLLSGMKGGVTGTGATEKVWTFTRPNTADPAPETQTVEALVTDGTNNYEIESGYCFTTDLGITAPLDGVPEMTAKMVGQKPVESTLTAAIAIPVLNYSPSALFSVYFDATFAGLGGTQISGQVLGFSWNYSWLAPFYALDGRAGLDFARYDWSQRAVADLSIDVLLDAAGANLFRTERTNKLASTIRFVQCKLLGPTLGGANYTIKLNGAYYHAADSLAKTGDVRDGYHVGKIHLMSAYDPTSTNDIEVIVTNALAAYY